jgi:hypothetical protein
MVDGAVTPGTPQLLAMNTDKLMEPLEIGVLVPAMLPVSELHAGQVGYIATGLKSVQDLDVGDTITWLPPGHRRNCPATSRSSRWSSPVSIRQPRRLQRPARCAGEAATQRRRARLPAGDEPGAGLWLPARLPGPLSHGDRPGAARTRVRHGHHLHRAVGGVPRAEDRRRDDRHRQPGGPARPDARSSTSRNRGASCASSRPPSTLARCSTWSPSAGAN